jgi:hypothetical protein
MEKIKFSKLINFLIQNIKISIYKMSTLQIVEPDISFTFAYSFIFASCAVGVLFGLWNWYSVMNIKPEFKEDEYDTESPLISRSNISLMYDISTKIQEVKEIIFILGCDNFSFI